MSALGQKQTLQRILVMSALPPKADIGGACRDVRYVPKADIAPHSIISSARADNVGGTSMPSALAVLRLMTSSNLVAGLGASENLTGVDADLTIGIGEAGPGAHQASPRGQGRPVQTRLRRTA